MTSFVIDPLNKFKGTPRASIIESCGLLPEFFFSVANRATLDHKDLTLDAAWEGLDDEYGFGLYRMTGSTVTPQGVWQYPEDPDLYPLVSMKHQGVEMLVYDYGLVALRDKSGETRCTRMD